MDDLGRGFVVLVLVVAIFTDLLSPRPLAFQTLLRHATPRHATLRYELSLEQGHLSQQRELSALTHTFFFKRSTIYTSRPSENKRRADERTFRSRGPHPFLLLFFTHTNMYMRLKSKLRQCPPHMQPPCHASEGKYPSLLTNIRYPT